LYFAEIANSRNDPTGGVCDCTKGEERMSEPRNTQSNTTASPWGSPEPYVQLVRCLLPRAASISLFDAAGEQRWTNDALTGPDLPNFVAEVVSAARATPGRPGEMRMLGANQPAYLCWLRDDSQRPLAILAIVCRAAGDQEAEARTFSFAHSLLRPALECLRRDLLAHATIEDLKVKMKSLDRHGVMTDGAATGLYTRPEFEQRMRAAVSDTSKIKQWTALYINADQLHVINDSFGMHVGDSVLSQLGELIRNRLPPEAFAGRISGDRFAVLVPMSLDDGEKFAESLREGVEQLAPSHGESRLHISISVGLASVDVGAGELMHALAAAETACKAAKDRGRNRVEVYQSNDASLVRRFADINIAGQLREAIDAGHLRLDAQLIAPFAKATDARPHFELLLRMLDDKGHIISFDRLLSAANRYQLMPTIDRWVVETAIAMLQQRASQLAGRQIAFAINFSGQSLHDDEFADFLIERIRASGLEPGLFCFELTENATMTNITRAGALMRRLRDLGCGVALDDFGTGLSSLSFLRQLPVTMLKIDGSFIRDVLVDARAESMVRSIAQLAHSMSMSTVAEYVETREICARVAMLGVDYGQGFAIGRPTPLGELLVGLPPLPAASRAAARADAARADAARADAARADAARADAARADAAPRQATVATADRVSR
jgi:diguanylate cyclase (GGDEF)-like protein